MREAKNHIQVHNGIYFPPLAPEFDKQRVERGPVVVFSSDEDLAASLTMLLEDKFVTVMETDRHKLLQTIHDLSPGAILADLPSSPGDSLAQIALLKDVPLHIPVILLRNYRTNQHLDREIIKLGAFVFFKPVDVEKMTELISELIVTEQGIEHGGCHEHQTAQRA